VRISKRKAAPNRRRLFFILFLTLRIEKQVVYLAIF